jgi:hypothetical protein
VTNPIIGAVGRVTSARVQRAHHRQGTEGSNPSPSSAESVANSTYGRASNNPSSLGGPGSAIVADHINGIAVLEYARQRYCRRLVCCSRTPASLCRPCREPSRAHPRGKPGFLTPKRKSRERQTLRWRKMDSNPRSPVAGRGQAARNQIFRTTTGAEAYVRRNKAADRLMRRAPDQPSRNLPPPPFLFRHRRARRGA